MPVYIDEVQDSERRPAEELRRIARYQRWIVASVLAQLALWAGCLVLSLMSRTSYFDLDFPFYLTVALGGVGGIYAFLIYCSVRNPFWGLVMGLGSLPPVLGLLTLTAVNGMTTRTLSESGVKVGLFGADGDSIEDTPGLYDEDCGW